MRQSDQESSLAALTQQSQPQQFLPLPTRGPPIQSPLAPPRPDLPSEKSDGAQSAASGSAALYRRPWPAETASTKSALNRCSAELRRHRRVESCENVRLERGRC